eukprot:scaffold68983_cov60-Phaeocystis_antarctica.AAC.2
MRRGRSEHHQEAARHGARPGLAKLAVDNGPGAVAARARAAHRHARHHHGTPERRCGATPVRADARPRARRPTRADARGRLGRLPARRGGAPRRGRAAGGLDQGIQHIMVDFEDIPFELHEPTEPWPLP